MILNEPEIQLVLQLRDHIKYYYENIAHAHESCLMLHCAKEDFDKFKRDLTPATLNALKMSRENNFS